MKNNSWIWIIAVVVIVAIIYFNVDIGTQTTISLPQCTQDSQCPKTIKNECPDFFQGCINNQCIYDQTNTICMNELVSIILQNEQLEEPKIEDIEGSKSFVFNAEYRYDSFDFGIEPFRSELDFECNVEEGQTLRFPEPNENCYITEASFMGNNYIFDNNQEIYLNEHIKVKVTKGGSVKGKETYVSKTGLSSEFLFTIIDPIEVQLNDNQEVLHDSNKVFNLNVKNNLPEGQFYIKTTNIAKQTNEILPETYITETLGNGDNLLQLSVDTENYGIHEFEARIFYKLTADNNEILLPLSKVSFKYNVVDELSGISGDVIVEEEDIEESEENDNIVLIVIGVIIGIIVLSRIL